jgi:2-C-methyl-D-erythritol 4-phosphate cytidylyltransferase / 2-C-methyl-D-erythritol 2,4-cyclodiphosphate synthase
MTMHQNMSTLAIIIPAGGSGTRMRHTLPKLLIPLDGVAVIEHTLRRLMHLPLLQMIIPVSQSIRKEVEDICAALDPPFPVNIVNGGTQRQDSVRNALNYLSNSAEFIAVHDAARPFFDPEVFTKALALLQEYEGALAALPATNTMKEVKDGLVRRTIPRETLWQINTPQVFRRDALLDAYKAAYEDNFYGTDDAMLLERRGFSLCVVPDSFENIKITSKTDLMTAEAIIRNKKGNVMYRTGLGYDVHRLVTGRKLVLGGVEIPYDKGCLGHSDADVLLHALMDALLGAAALGDIGSHFPDTDPAYKNADSRQLLEQVAEKLSVAGFRVENVDCTLILQEPKVASYIDIIRENIAKALDIGKDRVSVKATTEEGMGFTGMKEGAAAAAIAMLSKAS